MVKKAILGLLVLGFVIWPSARMAGAQGQVNDLVLKPRVFNDDPSSVLVSFKALPAALFADTQVAHPGNFANRHVWQVSEDGTTAKDFGIDDFFDISFDVTLLGAPIRPRKEAGIIVTTAFAGEGQFIVNTDAHEVVAFGGPFPFHAFPANYDSGETLTLRLRYFRAADGSRKIQYYANDATSGALDITNLEQGIPGPFRVGGYLQVVIDRDNLNNQGAGVFTNIRWNGRLIGSPASE